MKTVGNHNWVTFRFHKTFSWPKLDENDFKNDMILKRYGSFQFKRVKTEWLQPFVSLLNQCVSLRLFNLKKILSSNLCRLDISYRDFMVIIDLRINDKSSISHLFQNALPSASISLKTRLSDECKSFEQTMQSNSDFFVSPPSLFPRKLLRLGTCSSVWNLDCMSPSMDVTLIPMDWAIAAATLHMPWLECVETISMDLMLGLMLWIFFRM